MFESIAMREPALLIPIFAVLGGPVVFVTWIIAHYVAAARRTDLEMALKRDMLNRGMGAADIERVLASGQAADEPKETLSETEYELVQKMLEQKYSGEEVERMVRALRGGESPTAFRALERVRG
jgi:hypothetical protein